MIFLHSVRRIVWAIDARLWQPFFDVCVYNVRLHTGVYGLPSGDETPTNSIDTCWPWENQTTILEADAQDNATFGTLPLLQDFRLPSVLRVCSVRMARG